MSLLICLWWFFEQLGWTHCSKVLLSDNIKQGILLFVQREPHVAFPLHGIYILFIVIQKIFLELFWTFPFGCFVSTNIFLLFPSEFLLGPVKLIQPRVHFLRKRGPLWTVYQSASCLYKSQRNWHCRLRATLPWHHKCVLSFSDICEIQNKRQKWKQFKLLPGLEP